MGYTVRKCVMLHNSKPDSGWGSGSGVISCPTFLSFLPSAVLAVSSILSLVSLLVTGWLQQFQLSPNSSSVSLFLKKIYFY